MKRPDPKCYTPKQFLKGVYEEDLEKYIDYLESSFFMRSNVDRIKEQNRKREIERLDVAVQECLARLREVIEGRG